MKTTKTTKTTTTTKTATRKATRGKAALAVVLCSRCGRDNRRPEGVTGDCRNASACKARVAIVREAIAAGASL